MTYKPGDKFVIEIKDKEPGKCSGIYFYKFKEIPNIINEEDLDKLPRLVDDAEQVSYNKGMEDAWALMQRVDEPRTAEEIKDLFDFLGIKEFSGVYTMTPQEVKAKMDEYDNQIKVGDEVELISGNTKFIVTQTGCGFVYGINSRGSVHADYSAENLRKTGNNYAAELRELLDKIGGESE